MAGKGPKLAAAAGMWVWLLLLVGGFAGVRSDLQDCAIELYDRLFIQTLETTSTPWALVEFFASWSQESQDYKPHYESVACLFNDPNAVHGDEVYVTKVDCGIESNKNLCERFAIASYPILYWGSPANLATGGGSLKAKSGLESVNGGDVPTAERLLQWINKHIHKKYSLMDSRLEPKSDVVAAAEHASGQMQMQAAMLYDVEEATARAFESIMNEKTMRPTSRGSFLQFLHLLDVHHPSKRCRKGSAELLLELDELWPLHQPPTEALRRRQLCGPGLPRSSWVSCAGEYRGYSCGLWMLFHALSVRVEDFESSSARLAIEAFVSDFFTCEDCRDISLNDTSRTSLDSEWARRDLVLWLWRTHNQVNERLAQEEAFSGKAKGNWPKQLWPPESECPACRDSSKNGIEWDETAVYFFLMEWYGPSSEGGSRSAASQRSEKFVESVRAAVNPMAALPYWAAAGIAMASFSSALATYYWRSNQKKLKYRTV